MKVKKSPSVCYSNRQITRATWLFLSLIMVFTFSACTATRDAKERWTEKGASQVIRAYFQAITPDLDPKLKFPVEEITPGQVWDDMQIQIFKITGNVYTNETFLFNAEIMLQMGTAFGGSGVNSMLVSNQYGNGSPELYFTYDFGSGIRQSRMAVYIPSFDASRFIECDKAYMGDIRLEPGEDGGVNVQIVDLNLPEAEQEFNIRLGKLLVNKDSSQLFLDLEVNTSLPQQYYEKINTFK